MRLQVESEAYAIPAEQVREVATLHAVRAVPGSRRELLGVCNLRGVGELADQADDAQSGLLVGAALVGDDLVGMLAVPRVPNVLEQAQP